MRVLWGVFKFMFRLVVGIIGAILAIALSFIPDN